MQGQTLSITTNQINQEKGSKEIRQWQSLLHRLYIGMPPRKAIFIASAPLFSPGVKQEAVELIELCIPKGKLSIFIVRGDIHDVRVFLPIVVHIDQLSHRGSIV